MPSPLLAQTIVPAAVLAAGIGEFRIARTLPLPQRRRSQGAFVINSSHISIAMAQSQREFPMAPGITLV